ncbi:MAG: arginine N-succinyltransferase [Gammaproteobacteria bacterium]|uniref:Arginine N-succinyltransferase n=1 Tax=Marinobacter litoralis TaxID=187981 RepID=A0A3M2RGW5_9GAMM|nr:arginine N-succinyltransferase [Marinobacter litoralis]MBR9870388.1 arginine N-succinyltransferase [Gammaproteobacteria bacterium]RMJ04409.1 Arginine N-succinyltransferase subunit beta [Marinobacter litoralis]
MLIIRPLQSTDLEDLYAMAQSAGKGLTTLPADRELLQRKIDWATDSFSKRCKPEEALYLFALEDTETGRMVGISGIEARVGQDEVFYNYRLSLTVNASRELGVHVRTPTLHLSSDMTDATEICSLLLADGYKGGGNGLLLSRSRFMFLDDFREFFSDKVFAEMRGVSDKDGQSPLWNALGSKFFDMEFVEADRLSGLGNKSFIAELMPQYPIYLSLLPDSARAVISQVHDNTRPALKMLEAEGFNFNGLVDIFDGGPVVEAFLHTIRTVRDSLNRDVVVGDSPIDLDVPAEHRVMVSNRSFSNFRLTTLPMSCVGQDTVTIPQAMAEALDLQDGDTVRLAPLKDGGLSPIHLEDSIGVNDGKTRS